ncbi:hypothetical protein [Olsenella sp. HMSC062G07]|uniref:hypothetical protein n=1 Tax=Olsenella sp. HMSC062G07 TaxID=1739330 RepID=UPI0008A4D083|nr:hypothetical protein [Olsenella sp. HMSC062G07]OFK25064.1 hypothetical protein HMPREF2826_00310 [Olsenella sp. HMSC062G07]
MADEIQGYAPMTDRERLYVAQALFKAMGEYVSTTGDGLRNECDADLLAMYEAEGIKSLDAKVAGKKVGTYSVTVAKEKTTTGLHTVDPEALSRWAGENGFLRIEVDYKRVEAYFKQTGEVPDGCEVVTETTPEHAKGTVLRIDPQKVADALGTALPSAVTGLLMGEVG